MNVEQVIELVEKYIADPKSVSYEELRAAAAATYAVATWFAWNTTVHATAAALNGDIDDAKYWVAKYHKNHNV
tara:strand:+ start:342 stop:560 length:219 start_codon:yes stop_codon:yes gene_type:complete